MSTREEKKTSLTMIQKFSIVQKNRKGSRVKDSSTDITLEYLMTKFEIHHVPETLTTKKLNVHS